MPEYIIIYDNGTQDKIEAQSLRVLTTKLLLKKRDVDTVYLVFTNREHTPAKNRAKKLARILERMIWRNQVPDPQE